MQGEEEVSAVTQVAQMTGSSVFKWKVYEVVFSHYYCRTYKICWKIRWLLVFLSDWKDWIAIYQNKEACERDKSGYKVRGEG